MKKILCLILILLCSGCSLSESSKGGTNVFVPTTSVGNTTLNETDLTTLYDNCKKSVVTVLNYASYYDRGKVVTSLYGSGTAFVYSYDDDYIYLYTNAHVTSVSKGYTHSHYEIVFHDGDRYYGYLLKSDGSEDVAILRVERNNQDFAVATIGNSDSSKIGENIFTLGSPLGLTYSNTITRGIISNLQVEVDTDDDNDGSSTKMYLIQVDAALNPGNSGGPLFNIKGEVIGVSTLKITSSESGESVESFNFAIPINHFVKVANDLANKGSYSRPVLGVTLIDITNLSLSDRENYGISISKGLYIESITSGSVSDGILTKGRIITKINDTEVTSFASLACELYKYSSGETIEIITVNVSGGDSISKNITL